MAKIDVTFGQRVKLIVMLSCLQVGGLGEARAMDLLMDVIEFSPAETEEIKFSFDYETRLARWEANKVPLGQSYSLSLSDVQAAALVRALDRVPVEMSDRKWLYGIAEACKPVA